MHVVLAPCLLREHLREATAYMRERVVKKRADDVAWFTRGAEGKMAHVKTSNAVFKTSNDAVLSPGSHGFATDHAS